MHSGNRAASCNDSSSTAALRAQWGALRRGKLEVWAHPASPPGPWEHLDFVAPWEGEPQSLTHPEHAALRICSGEAETCGSAALGRGSACWEPACPSLPSPPAPPAASFEPTGKIPAARGPPFLLASSVRGARHSTQRSCNTRRCFQLTCVLLPPRGDSVSDGPFSHNPNCNQTKSKP